MENLWSQACWLQPRQEVRATSTLSSFSTAAISSATSSRLKNYKMFVITPSSDAALQIRNLSIYKNFQKYSEKS
jgi:hypothetical protein